MQHQPWEYEYANDESRYTAWQRERNIEEAQPMPEYQEAPRIVEAEIVEASRPGEHQHIPVAEVITLLVERFEAALQYKEIEIYQLREQLDALTLDRNNEAMLMRLQIDEAQREAKAERRELEVAEQVGRMLERENTRLSSEVERLNAAIVTMQQPASAARPALTLEDLLLTPIV